MKTLIFLLIGFTVSGQGIDSLNTLTGSLIDQEYWDSAIVINNLAYEKINGKITDTSSARVFEMRAELFRDLDVDECYSLASEVLKFRDKVNDQKNLPNSYLFFAEIFFIKEQDSLLFLYLTKGLEVLGNQKRNFLRHRYYKYFAFYYENISFSLKGDKKDSIVELVLKNFNKSESLLDTNSFDYWLFLFEKGIAFQNLNYLDSSLYYLKKIYPILLINADCIDVFNLDHNIGIVFEKKGLLDSAEFYYDRAKAISNVDTPGSHFPELIFSYLNLNLKKESNIEGLSLLDYYNNLSKDQYQENSIELLSKFHTLFKVQEKERENQRLEKNNYIKNISILSLSGLFILLSSIGVLKIRNNRQKAQVSSLQSEADKAALKSVIQNHEIELSQQRLKAQDAERTKIARDLHDQVGGLLSAINLHFESLNLKKDEKISQLLEKSIKTVRDFSHNLMHGGSPLVSLKESLEELAYTVYSTKKTKVNLFVDNVPKKMLPKISRGLMDITLELVANTLKYAEATQIEVQLSQHDGIGIFTYEDNGKGFRMDRVKKGLGLENIKYKAKEFGGALEYNTSPGNGVSVTIEFSTS